MPPQIIGKGIASPELLAQIMISKFADALPFYRQTEIFNGKPQETVLTKRRQEIAPILDKIEALLKHRQAKILPKSLLG
jgi:transposase